MQSIDTGGLLYLLGSICYTLAAFLVDVVDLVHVGNICFICGSILFVIDGRNNAMASATALNSASTSSAKVAPVVAQCPEATTSRDWVIGLPELDGAKVVAPETTHYPAIPESPVRLHEHAS
ncbi:unnamed protein product [Durusdinium trenchii]|uniref:YrhK domain-containing protein n=1 Tax=Durusdinium trenchii TaxID=1381693 RepID=A0ABP0IR65_9DINO